MKEDILRPSNGSNNTSVLLTTEEQKSKESGVVYVLAGKVEPEVKDPKEVPKEIKSLLKEYWDIALEELPSSLPSLRTIQHAIDLLNKASLPNLLAYRTNRERLLNFKEKWRN